MQQMQVEFLGGTDKYTDEDPKVTLTEKLARDMVKRKPEVVFLAKICAKSFSEILLSFRPYRFASDSKLIKKAYDHYWYGKGAGCAFITDQQREYTLKRLKQYDQLR